MQRKNQTAYERCLRREGFWLNLEPARKPSPTYMELPDEFDYVDFPIEFLATDGRGLTDLADTIDEKKPITDEEMDYINRMAYQENDLLARCCLINYHQNYNHPEQDFSEL